MRRRQGIGLLTCLLLTLPVAAQTPKSASLASKLGFAENEIVVLLHADDVGLVDSTIPSVIQLFQEGLVKSASIMVGGPAAESALQTPPRFGFDDLGLHLCLAGEQHWRPLAPAKQVPSLVDAKGFLHDNPISLFFFGKTPDVQTELEAQIQSALARGLRPTHLDAHMGATFYQSSWLSSYLNLARKYQIPPMVPRWSEDLKNLLGPAGHLLQFWVPDVLKKVEDHGFLTLDYLHIFDFPHESTSYESRKRQYLDLLSGLKPGVNLILFHPAHDSPKFRQLLRSRPKDIVRLHEHRVFQDPDVRQLIQQRGFRLIGWKDIQAIYPWAQVREFSP